MSQPDVLQRIAALEAAIEQLMAGGMTKHHASHEAGAGDALTTVPTHDHTGDAGDGGKIAGSAALTNVPNHDHTGDAGDGAQLAGLSALSDVSQAGAASKIMATDANGIGYTVGGLGIGNDSPAPNALRGHIVTKHKQTLTTGVTDGNAAGVALSPEYDAAYTVTRHNYIYCNQPVLTNSAAVTDACLARFDAAAGTHKAIDSGTTKTSPGTVSAWVKININGTIYYVPAYTSKTT